MNADCLQKGTNIIRFGSSSDIADESHKVP
jgi:hypothetical protein